MKQYKYIVKEPFATFREEIYTLSEIKKISTFSHEDHTVNMDGARRYDPRKGKSSKYYFDYSSDDVSVSPLTQRLVDKGYIELVGTKDNWGTELPAKAFSASSA